MSISQTIEDCRAASEFEEEDWGGEVDAVMPLSAYQDFKEFCG
jgi:hypothetical protein